MDVLNATEFISFKIVSFTCECTSIKIPINTLKTRMKRKGNKVLTSKKIETIVPF